MISLYRRLRGRALILTCSLLSSTAWGACSPIVIDTGGNGVTLGAPGVGVYFDMDNNGRLNHLQWVRPGGDEAFLALDRNGNSVVDNGGELFGVGTPLLLEGSNAPNGFVGLAQYDSPALGGNDDGYITSADAIWPLLRLWRDRNADGISTADEMFTPARFGILAFDTIPRFNKRYDAAGNVLPYWAWATTQGRPGRALMVDVFFLEI